MNIVITIIEPSQVPLYEQVLERIHLPVNLILQGRGTAPKTIMGMLGLENKLKRAIFSVAGDENTKKLMHAVRVKLFIDAPGNGITIAVPIKSVGGAKTLEYLSGNENPMPSGGKKEFANELIIAICNEGMSDSVMEVAREAGARGGTILHGKGTVRGEVTKFYNVTLAEEKELLMIVSPKEEKAAIMSAIMKQKGPATDAGAIVFSLPVTDAMGLSAVEE